MSLDCEYKREYNSRMQDDDEEDALNEFLKTKRVEEFHAQEQTAVPQIARQSLRSAADEVIDLLGGVKKPARRVLTCPKCGGSDFTPRSPLSGPKINQCTKCGNKLIGAPRSSVWMQGSAAQHGQGSGGAYYSGSESAPQNLESHPAKFRAKSRNYAALKDEENS